MTWVLEEKDPTAPDKIAVINLKVCGFFLLLARFLLLVESDT